MHQNRYTYNFIYSDIFDMIIIKSKMLDKPIDEYTATEFKSLLKKAVDDVKERELHLVSQITTDDCPEWFVIYYTMLDYLERISDSDLFNEFGWSIFDRDTGFRVSLREMTSETLKCLANKMFNYLYNEIENIIETTDEDKENYINNL